ILTFAGGKDRLRSFPPDASAFRQASCRHPPQRTDLARANLKIVSKLGELSAICRDVLAGVRAVGRDHIRETADEPITPESGDQTRIQSEDVGLVWLFARKELR